MVVFCFTLIKIISVQDDNHKTQQPSYECKVIYSLIFPSQKAPNLHIL